MPADRFGEPWSGAIYNGFSGASGAPPPPPRRGLSRGAIIGGAAAAAVALGLAAGFAFRPDQRALSIDDPRAEAQVRTHMPIQVDPPPPPSPLPRPAGKLEVLDPATAQAARAAQPAWTPARDTHAAAVPPPEPSPMIGVVPASPPRVAVPRPDPLARCAGASSRAEALVCADPQLAAYDRDLNSAYRRALRSGAVSPEDLRADQRDWLDDRERAARRSPEAMAGLYAQRIEELNRIADDGPG
jgi:uncharacterized protein YecT (DUF1311 family)